jgi:peptide deformylase
MYETMHKALGVGLAAPQVGRAIRLFIVETKPFAQTDGDDDDDEFTLEERSQLQEFKKVFINAKIIEEEGEEWTFNEGCLSIPKIREDVKRKPTLRIQYYDENFNYFDETYSGLIARVIQHEYDHIEGKLFVDKISPLRKRLIQGKLKDISKGKVQVNYKMRFPNN